MKIIFKHYKILNLNEHKELLKIRNDKNMRGYFINTTKIELQDHINWVESLNDEYFCVIVNEEIVGGVNFKDNEWGVFFNPIPFIPFIASKLFVDYLFESKEVLYSRVKKTNQKAISFNKSFGVEFYKEDDEYLHMRLEKNKWLNDNSIVAKRLLDKRDVRMEVLL